jgi:hypothetical protein
MNYNIEDMKKEFNSPNCNYDELLDKVNNNIENSGEEVSTELLQLKSKILKEMSVQRYYDGTPEDSKPELLKKPIDGYEFDKETNSYINPNTGDRVSYSSSRNGCAYGINATDKNGEKRDPTREEIEALFGLTEFKNPYISTSFSAATLSLMKEVCKEKGITICNLDEIDSKIQQSEKEKEKEQEQEQEQELKKAEKIQNPTLREHTKKKIKQKYSPLPYRKKGNRGL